LQVALCVPAADDDWEPAAAALGDSDRWVILRAPIRDIEARRLARALAQKWELCRRAAARMDDVEERTQELELANDRLRQEIARREQMEAGLRQASKLEAMGRLAAGIAHEINSPMQFVAASLQFIGQAIPTILAALPEAGAANDSVGAGA